MTNKEAKEKLYMEWQKFLEDNIDYAGISEAYKTAFKALEQEPCDDTISRQEAIDAFSMFAEYESNRTNAEWVDRIRVVLSSLPPVQSISRWISVSERLPEENGYYLTTTMYHEVYCDYWEEERFNRTEAVIAWMPLPKPYDPQESEDME